jgi:nicotinamide riboside transporter PnuC
MMTAFTWIVAILSLIGVVLNVRQDRRCFYLWIVTNSAWTAVDFSRGLYAQAFMFLVYLGLAIWGLYSWKHKRPA